MRFCKYLSGLTKPELEKLEDILHLTDDEREDFKCLANGYSYTKIAYEKNACERTIIRIAERIKKKIERIEI